MLRKKIKRARNKDLYSRIEKNIEAAEVLKKINELFTVPIICDIAGFNYKSVCSLIMGSKPFSVKYCDNIIDTINSIDWESIHAKTESKMNKIQKNQREYMNRVKIKCLI